MRPLSYEVWSDLQDAGGTRLEVLRDILRTPGPVDSAHILRHEYKAQFPLRRKSLEWAEIQTERVIRVQWTATLFDEWRIRKTTEGVDERGRTVGLINTVAPIYDLDRSGTIERIEADGSAYDHFEALGRTPTTLLSLILGNLSSYVSFGGSPLPYFSIGTVDPTDPVDFVFKRDTAYTAILELAKLTGSEFWWDYDSGSNTYRLHLLDRIGAAAAEVPLYLGRNVRRLEHDESSEEQATRVTPVGATFGELEASIKQNAWIVQTVSLGTGQGGSDRLTFVDDMVGEDDQLEGMGLYAKLPDGSLTAVVHSLAPNIVDVADGSSLSALDVVRFRRNAAGDEMTFLSSPAGEVGLSGRGIHRTLERPDVPPIDNEITNAYLTQGSGSSFTGYTTIGSPTIAENVNELHTRAGGRSAHVTANAIGDGLAAVGIQVAPGASPLRAFYTPQILVEMVQGRGEMFLLDVTNPADVKTYPRDVATERAVTEALGFVNLGMAHGIDHFKAGTQEFELHFVAAELPCEFYADAYMLTNTPSGVDSYFDGRASNILWLAALDELAVRRFPLSNYRAIVHDLNRLNAVLYPSEAFDMGADGRIRAPEIDFEMLTRIVGRERFLEHEARGRLELETEFQTLTRQLTERKRRSIRDQIPDHVKPPRCGLNLIAQFVGGDLEVTWDRTNWARVQLRDVTGVNGTPAQRFAQGVVLYSGDNTSWVLLDKQQTAQGQFPSQIDEVMIEAFNRWGKPGECYETADTVPFSLGKQCPNILPDNEAADPHCTADVTTPPATGTLVLHTFNPATAAGNPSIIPGQTIVSLCHEGATTASGGDVQGFGSYVVGVISSFDHQMYGVYLLSDEWSRARTIFGPQGGSSETFVACSIKIESGQFRQYHGYGLRGAAPDYLENRLTSTHFGEVFRPGVCITQEDVDPGDTGDSLVLASWGHTTDILTVEDLASHKIRLTRNPGDKWLGSSTIVTGTQTGTGTIDARTANDRAGGYWDKLEILTASDVVVATFLASEHPKGRIWMGDTYRLGSGFQIGPLCFGVNAAGTLCLEGEGYIYDEDWTLAASIDAGKYQTAGDMALDPGVGLRGSTGAELVRINVGQFPECVSGAVVRRIGNGAAPPGASVVFGTQADVRATLRATFDDAAATVITGQGVATGSLSVWAAETVLNGFLWPVDATQLTVEQLQIGTGSGEACSRNVMLNVGAGCCTFQLPQIGLPPVNPNCLQGQQAGLTVNSVDTCAGGGGVSLTVTWDVDQSDPTLPCDDGQNEMDVWWWEERDPSGFPGVFDLVRKDTNAALPSAETYTTAITDECIGCSGGSPSAPDPPLTNPRGSDATGPVVKQWRALVVMRHKFQPSQQGQLWTPDVSSPVAYNDC